MSVECQVSFIVSIETLQHSQHQQNICLFSSTETNIWLDLVLATSTSIFKNIFMRALSIFYKPHPVYFSKQPSVRIDLFGWQCHSLGTIIYTVPVTNSKKAIFESHWKGHFKTLLKWVEPVETLTHSNLCKHRKHGNHFVNLIICHLGTGKLMWWTTGFGVPWFHLIKGSRQIGYA